MRLEWLFTVVGGRNDNLKTADRYLHCPAYGRHRHKTIGNWYNALLQASGLPSPDYFGQTDPNLRDIDLKGPLSELTASFVSIA